MLVKSEVKLNQVAEENSVAEGQIGRRAGPLGRETRGLACWMA